MIAPHDPNAIDPTPRPGRPDASHPFGSDALGRDVFSRVLFAYRVSLGVAVGSVLVAMAVGVPLGLAGRLLRRSARLAHHAPGRPLAGPPGAPARARRSSPSSAPEAASLLFAIAVIYLPILARVVRGSVLGVAGRGVRRSARAPAARRRSRCMRQARPSERARAGRRAGERPDGLRDPDRGGALVPRARRAATDAVARADARRRPPGAPPGAVGRHLPGPGNRDRRARASLLSATACAPTSTPTGSAGDRACSLDD